jgi:predicted transcriptional regulator
MSKVKFDFGTVRTRVIRILKPVEVEDYPAKIGRVYGWSRQHVCYYLRKLGKCGLVKRKVRSLAVFYQLTSRGRTLLESYEDVVFDSGVYSLDRCQVRFWDRWWELSRRVLCMNKRLTHETVEKLFEKRGWRWALTRFAFDVWG